MIPLAKWTPGMDPSKVILQEIDFWVRFFGIPWDFYTEATAKVLSEHLGSFKRRDHAEHYCNEGEYMRVRVGININNPLLKSIKITYDNGAPKRVRVRYEKLKDFCYYCARLDHVDNECPTKYEEREEGDPVDEIPILKGFDSGMRVETPQKHQK